MSRLNSAIEFIFNRIFLNKRISRVIRAILFALILCLAFLVCYVIASGIVLGFVWLLTIIVPPYLALVGGPSEIAVFIPIFIIIFLWIGWSATGEDQES